MHAAAAPTETRAQRMAASGVLPHLPDAGPAGYLVGYLFDAGPVAAGGMGPVPLAWADLSHWQAQTGITLQPWESRGLRRLSAAYLAAVRDGEDPAAPAPNSAAPEADQRKRVAEKIRSIFGARAQAATAPGKPH